MARPAGEGYGTFIVRFASRTKTMASFSAMAMATKVTGGREGDARQNYQVTKTLNYQLSYQIYLNVFLHVKTYQYC